jgi:plastocyanin
MKKYILGISLMIAVVVVGIAACSKSDSTNTPQPPDTTPPTTAATKVSIKDFAFSPATVTIKPGESVEWTNADAAPHTATDVAGSFDSGTLATNEKFTRKFATAGTFTYHCTIHSMMATATVVVQ